MKVHSKKLCMPEW